MNIKEFSLKIFSKLKYALIALILLIFILKIIDLTHMRINAVFTELEPFSNLNVYYKGFKIGRATKVVPSKDFLTTRVTIVLDSWHYNLPSNIKAKVQKSSKDSEKDYMEIIYPSAPMLERIKYGDVIEGEISHNISDIFSNVADNGGLDDIKNNANNLLESANSAMKNLGEMLSVITEIMRDVQPNIKSASTNLSETTENLNKMSKKLETSVKEENISNALDNFEDSSLHIDKSTQNFEQTSENIELATQQINDETIPRLNETICSTKLLIENLNEIVKSVGNTLNKRMGGARLIFGKVK